MLMITLASIPLLPIGVGCFTLLYSAGLVARDLFLLPRICQERNNSLLESLLKISFQKKQKKAKYASSLLCNDLMQSRALTTFSR